MNIHLETDRLILRDIEKSDIDGMFKLDSDPEVHEFLGKKPITTKKQAEEVIEYIQQQYKEHGIGRWAVIHKKSGDFIGWSGLKYEDKLRKEFNYYDVGYRLRKEYWGQGIATETATLAMDYGFNKIGLEEIGAAAEILHGASNRILQKIGLNFKEQFEYKGEPLNFYSVKREDWNARDYKRKAAI